MTTIILGTASIASLIGLLAGYLLNDLIKEATRR